MRGHAQFEPLSLDIMPSSMRHVRWDRLSSVGIDLLIWGLIIAAIAGIASING